MSEGGNRPVRLFAPAKVNLGLEVTDRRADGYHEVVTLLESISIFDVIDIVPSSSPRVVTTTGVPEEDNLVTRAIAEVAQTCGVRLAYQVRIQKGIPEAAGLGGGSSDAGTVLAWLRTVCRLDDETAHSIAASIGSDVPFFLRGGVALARGTGTDLTPLKPHGRRWYVVLTPDLQIPGKTGALYGQLTDEDFSGGAATLRSRDLLETGAAAHALRLRNTFQRLLLGYPAVHRAMAELWDAGATVVLPSGAGPALFAVCDTYQEASSIARKVARNTGRLQIATSVHHPVQQSSDNAHGH